MSRTTGWIAVAGVSLVMGCGGSAQQAARARHAKEFDCSRDDVTVVAEGKLWNARGCGHAATYDCTRDAMETRCVMMKLDGKER